MGIVQETALRPPGNHPRSHRRSDRGHRNHPNPQNNHSLMKMKTQTWACQSVIQMQSGDPSQGGCRRRHHLRYQTFSLVFEQSAADSGTNS